MNDGAGGSASKVRINDKNKDKNQETNGTPHDKLIFSELVLDRIQKLVSNGELII